MIEPVKGAWIHKRLISKPNQDLPAKIQMPLLVFRGSLGYVSNTLPVCASTPTSWVPFCVLNIERVAQAVAASFSLLQFFVGYFSKVRFVRNGTCFDQRNGGTLGEIFARKGLCVNRLGQRTLGLVIDLGFLSCVLALSRGGRSKRSCS